MSTLASQQAPTAGARRRRFALQTVVLLLAITFACVFLGLIASSRRARMQIDLTGSSQHRLSERTRGVLAGLSAPYDVVVAGDMRSVDPLGRARTLDVLDAFARASEKVRLRIIDTSASSGVREFDALLADVAAAHKGEIEAQAKTVAAAADTASRLAESLGTISTQLLDAREAVPESGQTALMVRGLLSDDAARCRTAAENLTRAAAAARASLQQFIAGTNVPAIDKAAAELDGALTTLSSDLAKIGGRLDAVGRATDVPAIARDRAPPIAQSVRSLRENADIAAESLTRLPVLPIVAVVRTLERTDAALVIGPPRNGVNGGGAAGVIRAIEFGDLFPARVEGSAAGALDLRSRAEELVSTALVALGPAGEKAPIVVLVHDLPFRVAPNYEAFLGVVSRLRLRGMDILEWATALDPEPPALTRLDPSGKRPAVYVTLGNVASDAESALRMKRLADSQNRLADEGKNILFSAIVSTLPSSGNADPLNEALGIFGATADTGRPLLRQTTGPTGRLVTPDIITTQTQTEGAAGLIADAVDGLPCLFPWAVPIREAKPATGGEGFRFMPLIRVKDKDVWAESEWVSFAKLSPADRLRVSNPPAPDSNRDDATGEWTIAAALEIPRSGSPAPQRAVAVGSSRWFSDSAAQVQLGIVNGRPVYRAPGNLELLEAAVYWLAGQDEMIARSATAESIPLIPTLAEGKMTAIRWILIAGLPLIVLLIGAGWRLLRG